MDLARDIKNSHTLIKITIWNFPTFIGTSTYQEWMHSLPEGWFCPPTAPLRPKHLPCSISLKTVSRQLREASFPPNSTEAPIPAPAPLPLPCLPPMAMYTYPHIQHSCHLLKHWHCWHFTSKFKCSCCEMGCPTSLFRGVGLGSFRLPLEQLLLTWILDFWGSPVRREQASRDQQWVEAAAGGYSIQHLAHHFQRPFNEDLR